MSTRFHFLGMPECFFQVRNRESRKSLLLVVGEIRTHDPKKHDRSTARHVKEFEGINLFDRR